MTTFAQICLLVLPFLVEQLHGAEGERLGLRRRRRESQAATHPHSFHGAVAHFSRKHFHLSDGETCKYLADSPSSHLSSRSISPWKYKTCTDHARYPAMITMAECLSKSCNYPGTESSDKLRVNLQSVPLTHTIDVWYRSQGTGNITMSRLDIAIGCTCAVPKRRHG